MAEGNAITVKIGAETDGIERGLNEIQNSLKKIEKSGADSGESFNGSFLKMSGAVAVGQAAVNAFGSVVNGVFSAAQKVVDGFSAALDLGGTLSDLSASTGETAGNLLLLQRAFDNTGAGADKVGPALAKLQNNIFGAGEGSKEAVAAFGRMGISMEELAGKTPTQQLALVASGLTSIEDPTKRAATAIDIFGKSGAELLPLLTNFSGEMNEARATVGSMADIMDRRANVFDAVGDRFLIIQQKVRDFAAGILDKALPAIDAITSALSRIDAAAIGQNLANAFLGGENAMKGFQSAVDAISIGKVGLAFEVFWESLKLQGMQTLNEIIKMFSAAFNTISDIITNIFRSDGPAWATIISGIDYVSGYLKQQVAGSLADTASSLGPAFKGIAESLRMNAEAGAFAAEAALQRIPVTASLAAEEIGNELASSADLFQMHLSSANNEFFNTGEQAKVVKDLQDKITAATTATNAERATGNQALTLTGTLTEQLSTVEAALTEAIANGNTQLAEQLNQQKAILENKIQAQALEDQAKADKTKLVELETQLNLAKAAGNTELATALEKQLEQKKATEEIAKLTTEYQKTLGVTKDEAGVLATNFVNAKNAAAAVKVDKTTVSEAKAEASKAAEAAKSFATWLDYIRGVDPSAPVKSLKEQTADARKEITAFGEYIGTDLKNKSFPDIARELGIKNLGSTGSEQMQQILDYIASKRGELTGIQPIDEKGGKNSLQNIQAEIIKLGSTQQTLNLDATKSIEGIKSKLKENIDLAITTGEGTKILGDLKSLLGDIKTTMTTLSNKLPTHALA
jgi:hypothetical protein